MSLFKRLIVCGLVLLPAALPAQSPTKPTRLTRDGRIKFTPLFINKGREVVYVDFDKPVLFTLKVLNLRTSKIRRLHETAPTQELDPAFPSGDRLYAFIQCKGTLSTTLVIQHQQPKKRFEVPPALGFAGPRSPTVSPDFKRVLYSFAEGGNQHIFSVNAQAKDRKKLTDSTGINNWPCFSPDGKKVAFGSTRKGNFDIYIMDADGKNVRQITKSPFQDMRPRFSPDGKSLVFTSSRDGNYEIYKINVDGTGLQRVTRHSERDDYAAFHPDGKHIVLVSERNGRHDLYTLPLK